MNKFQEINSLRKEGKLEAAFQLAEQSLTTSPDDPWMKRAMGWVVYEYLNQSASEKDFPKFLGWMKKLSEFQIDASESMLTDSVLWSTRKILSEADGTEEQYDEMLSLLSLLPVSRSGVPYSALLYTVLKLDGKWKNILSFLQWWNMENLRQEDYSEEKMNNGKKMMSLAERAVICYSKHLLQEGTAEMSVSFIPFLKRIEEDHKEFVYPPYYLAKLMLKEGDSASAFSLLKKFAKSKAKDFWVWQLLAETQNDDDVKLSFLCKALSCGGKEEMLIALRESAALLFSKLGYLKEAKYEVVKALETRNRNNWKITNNLLFMERSSWFTEEELKQDNMPFYRQHSEKAESIVIGESRSYTCLITYVNKAKQIASFVTEDKKQGFFKIAKGICPVKRDCLISITTNEIVEGHPTAVRNVSPINGFENPSFYKQISGKFHNKGTFGLIGGVYVEPTLMKGFQDECIVKGIACISFDKKKNKWGWKAIKLESQI